MARFDLEKLAEELASKVRPDFEREIETARADGYRAGIEAARAEIDAQFAVASTQGHGDACLYLSDLSQRLRLLALTAPAAPKAPEREPYVICPGCALPVRVHDYPAHFQDHRGAVREPNRGALPCPVCDDGIQEKCPHCGREP